MMTGRMASPLESRTSFRSRFVAVVGPSGAGKDSIINAARRFFIADSRVVFPRRVITRPSGGSEPHEPVTEDIFRRSIELGDFALWWHANGFYYGLPTEISDELKAGHLVIANLSRDQIPEARKIFPELFVVHITAAPSILAQRLSARPQELKINSGPMERSSSLADRLSCDVEIDNSGALDNASAKFITLIQTMMVSRL